MSPRTPVAKRAPTGRKAQSILGAGSDSHPLGVDRHQVPASHREWRSEQKAARLLGASSDRTGFRWQDRYGSGNMELAIADLLHGPDAQPQSQSQPEARPQKGSSTGVLKRMTHSAKSFFAPLRAHT